MKPLDRRRPGFRLSHFREWRMAAALCWGMCVALGLALAAQGAAAESKPKDGAYTTALREYLAKQDEIRSNELAVLQRAVDQKRRQAFEASFSEHLQTMVQPAQAPLPARDNLGLNWALVAALSLVLGLRVGAPHLVSLLLRRFNPWACATAGQASALSPQALAEDPAWTGFVQAMEEGLKEIAKESAPATASGNPSAAPPGDPRLFFETAPQRLASLRTLFSEFGRATEAPRQPGKVLDLLREVQAFKESASAPVLLPVRQVTAAMVGLLSQLSKQPANLTPSTLRTLAAALDLLKDLCVRGVKPHLASEPPVRLLAVDDEPLTRGLVARALQKVFSVPDLASGGADALALAAKQSYDLVFLDVEMPGMDGFELCQKLHQSPLNAATPVIFVTRHSDFQARAKSTLHGAQDLIAKPFLAFELALKALTLILRSRLAAASPARQAAPAASLPTPAAPNGADATDKQMAFATAQAGEPAPVPAVSPMAAPQLFASTRATAAHPPEARESVRALLAQASAQFQSFRGQLDAVRGSTKPEEINALLAKFYPSIASFCSEAYGAKLNAAFRLGSALEAMLKKLLEKPKLRPPSTLESVALALDVLVELAQSTQDFNLDQTPARLLVVDDDLLARRMMGEALQLAFGRPEGAENGEEALALTRVKPFDLIYLDVVMPGMDGFAVCAEIRQSALNRSTPVMFVTSQSDLESRARATVSGASGFIAKPTLPCEITLVTISLLLHNRLSEHSQAKATPPPTAHKPEAPAPARVIPRKLRRRRAARQRRHQAPQVSLA